MPNKMRRHFAGPCSVRAAGRDAWRVTCTAPHETLIIIRGADPRAASALGAAAVSDLGIEWQSGRVLLTMMSAGRIANVEAATAIVHEAAPNLYATLPLAQFDSRARRFWRRVFLLVRIPGGRSLLGMIARVSRKRA
jgi:hypothetical protein